MFYSALSDSIVDTDTATAITGPPATGYIIVCSSHMEDHRSNYTKVTLNTSIKDNLEETCFSFHLGEFASEV